MIYVIFVLILFMTCLLIKSPKNKYSYFFSSMSIGLILMIISSVTLWKYDYPYIWIFNLDYKLMLKISATSWWKYYDMQNLFNFAIILYMASLQLFDYDLGKNKKKFAHTLKKISFLLFCIAYLWFYGSENALNIHIHLSVSKHSDVVRYVVTIANSIFLALQTFYILYPPVRLLFAAKRETFWVKQIQFLTFGIYILIINIFVLCFFVFGPLKNNYTVLSTNLLLGIRNVFRISIYHYVSIVAMICTFVTCILFIIFKAKLIFAFASLRRRIFKNRWSIDEDTREIFHMLKNVMFNIEAIAKQGLLDDEIVKKNERFNQISNLCEKKINDFFEITKISKRVNYTIQTVQIHKIIEEALELCPVSDDIRIDYQRISSDDIVYADFMSMTESIINVLKNAIESFEGIEREEKIITIKVRSDSDMVAIDIEDNGKGIDKKELRNVFKTFYTTKSRKKNWGVGLGFVYKTILAHCGHIKINSVKGRGTCVSIILYREGAYKL